ncbi:hypothetical protein BT96DRAFT_972184, partial [Gymnopus androsaceus JB14]
MSSSNPRQTNFQLRMNVDFEGIHRWLRMEYGPGNQPEPEISRVLADVDKDLEDCSSELRYLQSHVSFLQNQHMKVLGLWGIESWEDIQQWKFPWGQITELEVTQFPKPSRCCQTFIASDNNSFCPEARTLTYNQRSQDVDNSLI